MTLITLGEGWKTLFFVDFHLFSCISRLIIYEFLDDFSDVFNVLNSGREMLKILGKWENIGFGGC